MEAIVAVYSDWGIGARGTQPIVIPEDRRRFAPPTKGATAIAGRRTLADFPGGKPPKERADLVITRHGGALGARPVDRTRPTPVGPSRDGGRV